MSGELSTDVPQSSTAETPSHSTLSFCVLILEQLRDFILSLSYQHYEQTFEITAGASIGAHTRHCIDHFNCFFKGIHSGIIDYDKRDRNPQLETNIQLASHVLNEQLLLFHQKITPNTLRKNVLLCSMTYTREQAHIPIVNIPSTIERELLYITLHCIHHMATISLLAQQMGLRVPPHFGVAPSTLLYQKSH